MSDIKYQVAYRDIVVTSRCPICGRFSRGRQRCYHCLTNELAMIVGTPTAKTFLNHALALFEAEQAVLMTAEKGHV